MSTKAKVIAAALGLVMATFIVGLPVAVEVYVEGWLADQGVPFPEIDDVDVNLFTGVVTIEALDFSGTDSTRASVAVVEVNFEWTQILAGRLVLSAATLDGVRLDIRQADDGRYALGGLVVPLASATEPAAAEAEANDDDSSWGFGLNEVVLRDVDVDYVEGDIAVRAHLRDLSVDHVASWEPDGTTRFLANLEINDAPVAVQSELGLFAEEPFAQLELDVQRFSLSSLERMLSTYDVHDADGFVTLNIDGRVRLSEESRLNVRASTALGLEAIRMRLPQIGSLTTDRADLNASISAVVPAGEEPQVSGSAGLEISGLHLRHGHRDVGLLSFEHLALSGVEVAGSTTVDAEELTLDRVELLRADDVDAPVVGMAQIRVNDFAVDGSGMFRIGAVTIDALDARLVRGADGAVETVSEVLADFPAQPDAESPGAEPTVDPGGPPTVFEVGRIEVTGDSVIRVTDHAVEPVVVTKLTINRGLATGLGNIDTQIPMQVALDIEQGDSANMTTDGEVWLFGADLASDLKLNLERFDLSLISSYVPAYDVHKGRLSVQTLAKVTEGELDISNTVSLEQLELIGNSDGEPGWLGAGMAMPLDVALDMLRNSDDTIALQLPVTGSIDDPEFNTQDILRIAMQNALQKAALSYAKNALQPLGTILLVAKVAGQAARPRFDPVIFAAGDSHLNTEAGAYLEKIGALLADRPQLSITLCGVSNEADRHAYAQQAADQVALQDADQVTQQDADQVVQPDAQGVPSPVPPVEDAVLIQLARDRVAEIHSYFTGRHRVDPNRLFGCKPALEDSIEAPGRVEITL